MSRPGTSRAPRAWPSARVQARIIALQLEYSLLERNIEREHIPAALELGAAIVPWSPLASGMLSGKYTRQGTSAEGEGRLRSIQGSGNPGFEKLFTKRNWAIVDTVVAAARELERPPAQIALNWVVHRPGVGATLVGATKLDQLEANLRALDFDLPAAVRDRLERVSRPELVHPYHFFESEFFRRGALTGGTEVHGWQEATRSPSARPQDA
jgi:aryl-alcohol dehydrogenase-like predicted oxidoreductase